MTHHEAVEAPNTGFRQQTDALEETALQYIHQKLFLQLHCISNSTIPSTCLPLSKSGRRSAPPDLSMAYMGIRVREDQAIKLVFESDVGGTGSVNITLKMVVNRFLVFRDQGVTLVRVDFRSLGGAQLDRWIVTTSPITGACGLLH